MLPRVRLTVNVPEIGIFTGLIVLYVFPETSEKSVFGSKMTSGVEPDKVLPVMMGLPPLKVIEVSALPVTDNADDPVVNAKPPLQLLTLPLLPAR